MMVAAQEAVGRNDLRLVRSSELELQRVAHGVEDPVDAVNVLLVRARLRSRCGDPVGAARLSEQALVLARLPAPRGDQNVMCRLLVQALADTADFRHSSGGTDVEGLLTEALNLSSLVFGERDPDTASVWNSLGMYYRYCGRFDEAERAYASSLAVWADAESGTLAVSQIAPVLHNLASLRHLCGDLVSAEQLIRDALSRRGAEGLGRAADLAVLAAVLCDAGRLEEASQLYEETRTVLTGQHGTDSLEMAYLDANAAVLTHRMGDLPAADAQYQSALLATERLLGTSHRQVGVILANQAQLARQRDERDRAVALATRAVGLLEADAGGCQPEMPALRLAIRLARGQH